MKKIALLIFVLLFIASCLFSDPVKVTVSDRSFLLSERGQEIQCTPPLIRVRNDGSLMIKIKEDWRAEPPWKQIILTGGKAVTISVVLLATDGRQFSPSIIGSASGPDGRFIDVRFNPQIPKDVKIQAVTLKASSPISVEAIIWQNFDPE
jgi:hypothetical protein